TPLPFDGFLKQVRQPRAIMPPFPAEVVSDAEAHAIYDYVKSSPPAAPRLRTDIPKGVLDPKTCAPCHAKSTPTIVQQFETSAMGKPGKQNPRVTYPTKPAGCAGCHGTNHDDIMATKGRVPETTCGACHPEIYKEHITDAGHSYGPGPGGLGI